VIHLSSAVAESPVVPPGALRQFVDEARLVGVDSDW
jgi:hypothetical protein